MQKQPASAPDGANRPVLDGRNGDRGMVVYVDAQLRMSKRFDAAGIQRDYPHLLQPVNRRRSASSASITTMASMSLGDLAKRPKDEGQLRYWTSEMCSNSPQLFDFVVTVGDHDRSCSDAFSLGGTEQYCLHLGYCEFVHLPRSHL